MSRVSAALALALGACEPAPKSPPFALERVVAPAIAELEAQIERETPASGSAVSELAAVLANPRSTDAQRVAAIDGLAAIDSPQAAATLAAQVETARTRRKRSRAPRTTRSCRASCFDCESRAMPRRASRSR